MVHAQVKERRGKRALVAPCALEWPFARVSLRATMIFVPPEAQFVCDWCDHLRCRVCFILSPSFFLISALISNDCPPPSSLWRTASNYVSRHLSFSVSDPVFSMLRERKSICEK